MSVPWSLLSLLVYPPQGTYIGGLAAACTASDPLISAARTLPAVVTGPLETGQWIPARPNDFSPRSGARLCHRSPCGADGGARPNSGKHTS